MLDIKLIRQNPQKVIRACKNKNYQVDVYYLLKLDNEIRFLKKEIELENQIKNIETEMYQLLKPLLEAEILKIEDGVIKEN
jgi:seryl-tRNA synthetase